MSKRRVCYPFLDKYKLCPEIDTSTKKQRLDICTEDESECESISCIHTKITDISPQDFEVVRERLNEAETQEEQEKIWEEYSEGAYKSSEFRRDVDLPLDTKWMMLKSYSQGLSEMVNEPSDLLSYTGRGMIGHQINMALFSFLVEQEPRYLHDYFYKIEKECNVHKSCVLARLDKIESGLGFFAMDDHIDFLKFKDKYEPNEKIDLGNRKLDKIPEEITELNLDNLKKLYLYGNRFTEFPESIGNLKKLEELYLNQNKLTELPDSIGDLKNLKELHLGWNRLTELPESIGNLKKLEYLNLGDNQLTELPESFENLKKLEQLSLDSNRLTELHDSIKNLKKLKKLNLWNNKLTELPESFENLKKLEELYLDANRLTELPDSIGKLKKLKELNVSDNLLTELPDSIGNLKNLEKLDLVKNKLTELPDSIGDLKNLEKLDLSDNQLTEDECQRTEKELPNTYVTYQKAK